MEKKEEQLNASELRKKALKQLMSGESLYGKNGAFAPMLKSFLEAALEGELDAHLDEDERKSGNRKNGKLSKTLQTSDGPLEIETSRDRHSTFEPELVKKRETILADSLEKKIIGMYGLGMSFRDISNHLKEMYDADISHSTLSSITDRIIPEIKEWQARPLEGLIRPLLILIVIKI
jgi:transposase-like protein